MIPCLVNEIEKDKDETFIHTLSYSLLQYLLHIVALLTSSSHHR